MQHTFEIISYVGAKPLLFGMTQDEVGKIIVENPRAQRFNDSGEFNVQYASFSIRYSVADSRLVEIGFSDSAKVLFGPIDVFQDPSAFSNLVRQDSCPYECFGFIVLLDLGVTLTGFHDNDPSQLSITAFIRGRWDFMKPRFRKFQMPF
jgi:hypothetical protein